jgi:hypothetical protein
LRETGREGGREGGRKVRQGKARKRFPIFEDLGNSEAALGSLLQGTVGHTSHSSALPMFHVFRISVGTQPSSADIPPAPAAWLRQPAG